MKKITKLLLGAALSLSSVMGASAQSTPNFEKEQYQKALWMTARFYGAQRMGDGVNWLVATHEPTEVMNGQGFDASKFVKGKSYLKDADGTYDLTGGWFDCGDFVLFGQTFFYSAYMLILGYSEFPEGYDDYYSFDYSGYIGADDYTWEGKKGKPNGIPDILDEVKYATDFIMKAVRDSKTFYFQKGDGDADHKVWCTSTVKSAMPVSNGGEKDGSRAFKKASGGETAMSSLAGATLAAMARLYKKFDPEYAQKCLEKALVAYDFATNTALGTTDNPGFYVNKPKYEPDLVIFSAEMYRATGDKKYLTKAEQYCTWMNASSTYNYNYSLCYNNTEDLAVYLIASLGNATSYGEKAAAIMDFYVNDMYKPTSGYVLNKKGDFQWGTLRYPCNQAFTCGLYSKLKGEKTLNPYALTSIEFVMGKNPGNRSFIVGFGENYPREPHHRNFYRWDGNKPTGAPVPTTSYKFIQLGFLVGGDGASLENGSYGGSLENYTLSEGGIDYNAGLVGALGYINSIINPVNVNKFGHPTPDLGEDISICGKTSVVLNSNVAAAGQRTFTWFKDGVQVESSTTATTYAATSAGVYTCKIDSAGQWQTEGTVTVKAELPEISLEDSYELCNPASITLDATMDANVTYAWSKDGKALANGTGATYVVTHPGEYKCVIASTGCESVTLSTTVTSLLPEVADAESDATGNVTMTITSAGDYEWYDVAEGGTPIATGSTYSTKITADKLFYVQDAGAMDIVVGPSEKDLLSNANTNWGKMAVRFTASKECSISAVTLILNGTPYNTGSNVVTAELSGAASGKYTSESINVTSGMKSVKVNFPNPITIPAAGSYSLLFNCDAFAIGYYETMSNYSSFPNSGNPLTFVGVDKDKSGFMGVADWNVTAGTGCARAIVKATKGNSVSVEDAIATATTIYPNPCKDMLYIDLQAEGFVKVEFVNLLGSVVKAETTNAEALQSGINVADLAKGMYVVRITNGANTIIRRIIKE